MNQKGFANIMLVVLVVVLAGVLGYITLLRKPSSIEQPSANNIQNKQPMTQPPAPSGNINEQNQGNAVENQRKTIVFDPYKVKAGDVVGNFKVVSAKLDKTPSGEFSNFEIKFSGEGNITGKIVGISDMTGSFCFETIDALSKDLLPRMKNEGVVVSSVHFCFSNRNFALQQLQNKSTANVIISDFVAKFIIPDDIPNRATLVNVISSK